MNKPDKFRHISSYISNHEAEELSTLIPTRSSVIYSSICKFYVSNRSSTWTPQGCGIVCLEKDSEKKSYFIRIYSVQQRRKIFDQELFMEMDYNSPLKTFHIIQSDGGPVGLSFHNGEEANDFFTQVHSKIASIKDRAGKNQPVQQVPRPNPAPVQNNDNSVFKGSKPALIKKGGISAKDISGPSDFRHIEHMSIGQGGSVNISATEENQEYLRAFKEMGIANNLQTKEEFNFAKNFLNSKGGLEALKRDGTKAISSPVSQPQTTPQHPAPQSAPTAVNRPAPRAPPRHPAPRGHPAPPSLPTHHGRAPPPPPRAPAPRPPPPPVSSGGGGSVVSGSGAPRAPGPPPPPPPGPAPPAVLGGGAPPPPGGPPPPPSIGQVVLKPATPRENGNAGNAPAAPFDLQKEIQSFSKNRLNKTVAGEGVSKSDKPLPAGAGGGGDLISSLLTALDKRRNLMNNQDENSDDEWESGE